MLQLKVKKKKQQWQKIFYGGSGICYTSKKIGNILGEGIHKEGHRGMENGKCVLRTIGPIWLDHKVYILCRGVKITKIWKVDLVCQKVGDWF